MRTTRGYKFRMYPNAEQRSMIHRTLGCCRFVYNRFLSIRHDEWFANHHSVGFAESCKLLTGLKRREETSWLKEVDAVALQQALRTLDRAFQNFFKKLAKYPRFKSKHCHQQSYRTMSKGGIQVDGEEDVSFAPCGTGNIGIDVGIKEFFTDSNGAAVENPRVLCNYQKKLAREQRRLARKMPHSRNRENQRIRVARVYEHIRNIRRDFLQKLTTRLIDENQVIAVERLKVKNMLRNHKLAKAISDVSWSAFFQMLTYKAAWRGATVLKVDTFFPSSQTCSVCGHQYPITKDLSVREWTCPACGTHHDRDENAAKNILKEALRMTS